MAYAFVRLKRPVSAAASIVDQFDSSVDYDSGPTASLSAACMHVYK